MTVNESFSSMHDIAISRDSRRERSLFGQPDLGEESPYSEVPKMVFFSLAKIYHEFG